MSDEIDIEEHDLLDDPAIKNIFPDLSKLKKEILDYYDEGQELETISTFQTPFISDIDHEDTNVSTPLNVFEGSLPSANLLDNSQESEAELRHLTTEKTRDKLCNNNIISRIDYDDRNVSSTSLNVSEYECQSLSSSINSTQDSEVEPHHSTTENIQIQLLGNKIILGTENEENNVSTSNVVEDTSMLSDNLLENSKGSEIELQHRITEKKQILLGTDPDDNVSSSMNVTEYECLPPDNLLDNSKVSQVEQQHLTSEHTQLQLFSNKIILGSKPIPQIQDETEYYEKHVKPYSAVVKLVEYGDYLNNSSRYCKHCLILFPKKKDLDFHKKLVHLVPELPPTILTVALPVTETKINLNDNKIDLKENDKKHKCEFCNAVFSYRSGLNRHKNKRHNKIFHAKTTKIKRRNNIHQNQKSKTMLVKSNECFHCKKIFKDQKSLIEHIYSILQKPSTSSLPADNKNNVNEKSDDVMVPKNKSYNNVKQVVKGNKTIVQKNERLLLKNDVKKAEKGNKSANQLNQSTNNKNQIIRANPEFKTSKVDQGGTFYRCHYCSYYFNKIQFYAAHVKNKHQLLKVPKVKKVPFNPKCKFCNTTYNKVITFNAHLHKRHPMKIKENIVISSTLKKEKKINNSKTDTTAISSIDKKSPGTLQVFRCCYCSHYYLNVKRYATHIIWKHKVQRIPKAKKISFDPKCKYCPKISQNIKSYNKHLYGSHYKRLNEVFEVTPRDKISSIKNQIAKKEEDKVPQGVKACNNSSDERRNASMPIKNLILKSVLFKCNKCDIHFLSLKTAVDHTNHMELLINWKCSICHKIFKKNDKQLHEKQHTLSNVFTVYEISEADVPKVLYKCSKCTIHFDEVNYLLHSSDCNLKTPQSAYCKICDILVAKNATKSHDNKHKFIDPNGFIIIESDFIVHNKFNKHDGGIERKLKTNTDMVSSGTNSNKASALKRTRKVNYFLTQSYCDTCKCFVSNCGGTRKVHVQSACSHMTRHTCLDCGLTLTSKAMATHQKLHSVKKELKLQDYTFYDLRSGKQINPPIPDYHKCNTCNVHFISKTIMRSHLCNEKEFRTCHICEIKLSKPIYHLHMAFHSYSMNKVNAIRSKKGHSSSERMKISESNIPTPNKLLIRSSIYFMYTCNNCNSTVDTYDKMILHCQEHFSNKKIVLSTKECIICNLNIDTKCYAAHINFHQTTDKIRLEKLNYDLFYFRLENDIWLQHVFGSRPREQIKEIIKKSVYKFEHRTKMEILQESESEYTLYKCKKCLCFIEPDNIYKHTGVMCAKLRKYPCSVCGLPFISALSRSNHEKYHERPDFCSKSYRIVMFNRTEGSILNSSSGETPNLYVFYQCRKCRGVVDKSHRSKHKCNDMQYKNCTYCGLLFNKKEYEPHISKHKTLNSFVSENMKVILFGQNNSNETRTSNKLKAFRGIIYDYSFFKCVKCQICEKDAKFNHICTDDNSKIKCSKCNIFLYSNALVSHLKKHENDPDFEIENMNFIDFDPTVPADVKKNVGSEGQTKIMPGGADIDISRTSNGNNDMDARKTAKIYKCPCGLHFLNEETISAHLDQCGAKTKQSKQNCFKCGLLFTPKVLFTHVVTHHGDIKNTFKFNIINVPKKS